MKRQTCEKRERVVKRKETCEKRTSCEERQTCEERDTHKKRVCNVFVCCAMLCGWAVRVGVGCIVLCCAVLCCAVLYCVCAFRASSCTEKKPPCVQSQRSPVCAVKTPVS